MQPRTRRALRALGGSFLPAVLFLGLLVLDLGLVPPAGAEEEGTALDRFFHGKVTAFEKGVVTIRYDFSDAEQLKDWVEGLPFPVRRQADQGFEVKPGGLEIRGNTGVQHTAIWKGDVDVKTRIRPDRPRDVGGLLVPSDGGHDFASFTIREFFFHSWDNSQGGQNSIIKFGDQWREGDASAEYIGFRYVVRRPQDGDLVAGRAMDFSFGVKRGKLVCKIGRQEMKGTDFGVKLAQSRPGMYVVKEKVLVESLEITGKLDPDWMTENGVALRLETPLPDHR